MYYVYLIQNLNNFKVYVGQCKNMKSRWKSHRDCAVKGDTRPLYHSMRKYGFNDFEMHMIEEFDNLDDCNNAEEFWIKFFQSQNREIGYNIAYGGNNHLHTPETKAKLSVIRAGATASEETKQKMSDSKRGEKNVMFGRKHSAETIKKMSDAKKGKYDGENNPFYGKAHTEETKLKISESNIGLQAGENNPMFGKTHTEETRKLLSEINSGENHHLYGKHHSDETKSKLSTAMIGKNKGKKMSEETRRKMSESKRGKPSNRWKNKDINIID